MANVGDWSEIYVFYKIMEQGQINTADNNMNIIYNAFLPVLKIIREEQQGVFNEYYTSNADNGPKTLQIYTNNTLLGTYPITEFSDNADLVLQHIREAIAAKTTSSISMPDVESNMNSILITKVKAPASAISATFGGKSDITMEIKQQDGLIVPAGFSIKSSLGHPSSLANSSNAGNFYYKLTNCNDTIMNTVNAINTHAKIVDRVHAIQAAGCDFVFDSIESNICKENLELIADTLPEITAQALLNSYIYTIGNNSKKSFADALQFLIADNMHNKANPTIYYRKRLEDLLFSIACGMNFDSVWDGILRIRGGYIFVTKTADVLAYYASDQDNFKKFLLDNTKFDTPSTSRRVTAGGRACGIINKENNDYYFTLNLAIKFIK